MLLYFFFTPPPTPKNSPHNRKVQQSALLSFPFSIQPSVIIQTCTTIADKWTFWICLNKHLTWSKASVLMCPYICCLIIAGIKKRLTFLSAFLQYWSLKPRTFTDTSSCILFLKTHTHISLWSFDYFFRWVWYSGMHRSVFKPSRHETKISLLTGYYIQRNPG